jgi:hypothetical protein
LGCGARIWRWKRNCTARRPHGFDAIVLREGIDQEVAAALVG